MFVSDCVHFLRYIARCKKIVYINGIMVKSKNIKINLVVITMLLSLVVKAQTNAYAPFPDSAAAWNINFSSSCIAGDTYEKYSIQLVGDTSINNQKYHKLGTPYVQSMNSGTCDRKIKGYKGAIRQDILKRKVYFIAPASKTEQLLYDFNLQVGDTVKGYLVRTPDSKNIIKSIDSVLVGAKYCKRWNFNCNQGNYIIEGLGSTFGLIEPLPACAVDLPDYSISCFSKNNKTVYPDKTTNCQLITGIKTFEKESYEIKIHPNPAIDFLTIEFDEITIKEILLTDMYGNKFPFPQNINQKTFNILHLQSGTYVLTLTDKANFSTYKKVMVIH
jgi:hypothetical protein